MSGNVRQYELQVECSDLQVEVGLNGLPVFSQARGTRATNAFVNDAVIDGRNTVTVRLAAVPGVVPAQVSAHAEVRISIDTTSAYAFAWEAGRDAKPLPLVAAGEFQSVGKFGQWSWQRADKVAPSTATIDEINDYIRQVHDALAAADRDRTRRIFRVKAQEQATAFGIPLNAHLADQDKFYREWFNQPAWGMEPIDFGRLDYKFHAQGRVVGVQYKDGLDVLRSYPNADGASVSFPLLISRIDGQWTIVR